MQEQFTEQDVRSELALRLETMTQTEVADAAGMFTTNVSKAFRGDPIPAKLLAWLGYQRCEGIYERRVSK
jgi:hypothetical protein